MAFIECFISDDNGNLIERNGMFVVTEGSNIKQIIVESILISAMLNRNIYFLVREIEFEVAKYSSPILLYREWSRANNGYIKGKIGPYPAVVLSEEEIASDERIRAEKLEKKRKEV